MSNQAPPWPPPPSTPGSAACWSALRRRREARPRVALIVSADTVRVGEQVDVVTAAWFPRDLRLQLRRPPTLQPPVIDGVWSYPQAAPSGIAVTRRHRRDRVRPLRRPPGGVSAGAGHHRHPARHAEVQHAARPPVFQPGGAVRPHQPGGDAGGAAATDRRAVRRTSAARWGPGSGSSGGSLLRSPTAVKASPSSSCSPAQGNTALWPPPEIRWPRTARAYCRPGGRTGGTTARAGSAGPRPFATWWCPIRSDR